jgi:hypothetical protein
MNPVIQFYLYRDKKEKTKVYALILFTFPPDPALSRSRWRELRMKNVQILSFK